MKTVFSYNQETKVTTCEIQIKDRKYVGTTKCHVEDTDMESTKIGEEIAYHRALVKLLKGSKKFYLSQRKTLQDFKVSLGKCKRNAVTYRLDKEISRLDASCDEIDVAIESIESQVLDYISKKQKFQDKVRKLRKTTETAE